MSGLEVGVCTCLHVFTKKNNNYRKKKIFVVINEQIFSLIHFLHMSHKNKIQKITGN